MPEATASRNAQGKGKAKTPAARETVFFLMPTDQDFGYLSHLYELPFKDDKDKDDKDEFITHPTVQH